MQEQFYNNLAQLLEQVQSNGKTLWFKRPFRWFNKKKCREYHKVIQGLRPRKFQWKANFICRTNSS